MSASEPYNKVGLAPRQPISVSSESLNSTLPMGHQMLGPYILPLIVSMGEHLLSINFGPPSLDGQHLVFKTNKYTLARAQTWI